MESVTGGDIKPNGPTLEKRENGGNFPAVGEIDHDHVTDVTHDIVTSESRTPLKTPVKDVEVKFIVNDSINGDAKVDIDNVKSTFAGMAKEELLKYTNDPFWVRMRLFLFILFWAIWVSMFVGAIAIIVMAPRCESPQPRKWFQTGPIYEVQTENLKGLKIKLPYLAELDIKGLILPSIFKTDDTGDAENVVDFKAINEDIGTLEDLKKLSEEAKAKSIHLILSFVPNHSSDKHIWFNKSVAREAPYDDFYVWASPAGSSSDGSRAPPNNWLSQDGKEGESAWEWNEERKQYYLHQFKTSQPDLNFHNPLVLKEFNDTLSFWLDFGITSFNIDKAQFLLEDPQFGNETVGTKPGAIHDEYDFYNHHKTYNLPGDANILASWRKTINKNTEEGILMITGEVPTPSDVKDGETSVVVDLARSDKLLAALKPHFTAQDLKQCLDKVDFNGSQWPAVQISGPNVPRIADRFLEYAVDGLNMITLLLPGTPITYFGDEVGLSSFGSKLLFPWNDNREFVVEQQKNATESHLKNYQALVKARVDQSVLYGNTSLQVNGSLITLTRIKAGNPGYLVVYNPSGHTITTDLHWVQFIPDELTVLARSVNLQLDLHAKDKVKRSQVTLTTSSAIVFTFVPKMEE